VAQLIESAFSGRLDPTGRRMLRWMRRLGRAGWIGWLFGWLVLPPAAHPHGFVWEEEGRIVGNASVMMVEGHQERWVLANVAVDPNYRRKGVGRALVQASVDLVKKRRGRVILLQVDSENHGAKNLYASLGFRPLTTRTTWVCQLDHIPSIVAHASLARRRQSWEWQEQWKLVRRIHPEGLVWPFPPVASLFRPYGLAETLGLGSGRHWVWYESGQLIASLTARWGSDPAGWRLFLVVDDDGRERVEEDLLAHGLADLPMQGKQIWLNYLAEVAGNSLQELGFRRSRTLTWMGTEIDEQASMEWDSRS
jgi:ribosomal protein S18 acetylase RimI-like enzyme